MMPRDHIAAVAAVPFDAFSPFEKSAVPDVLDERPVTGLMKLFHLGDFPEGNGHGPAALAPQATAQVPAGQ